MFNPLYVVVCPGEGKQPHTIEIKYLAAAAEWHTKKMNPAISIVIITYNSAAQIGTCLRALQQQGCDYEIVVVDNGSRDDSRAIVAGFPGVRLVAAGENLG